MNDMQGISSKRLQEELNEIANYMWHLLIFNNIEYGQITIDRSKVSVDIKIEKKTQKPNSPITNRELYEFEPEVEK
jgi:hypothetical protein